MSETAELAKALAAVQAELPDVKKNRNADVKNKEGKYLYCLAPETRVLTADLRWVPVGTIGPGDRLAAFDEEPDPGIRCRRWRTATVEAAERVTQPCYRVALADGTVIVASETHRWLAVDAHSVMRWVDTRDLRAATATAARGNPYLWPTGLVKVLPVWDAYEESFENGYLAAAFDGEGTICQTPITGRESAYQAHLSFAQRGNAMLERVRMYLEDAGFAVQETSATGTNSDVHHLRIGGGRSEVLRFLGTVRPVRLLGNFSVDRIGAFRTMKRVIVQSIEFIGDQEVVAVATSTRTLVAEGIASHNSYSYADLADVSAAVLPILGRHGLAFAAFPGHQEDGKFGLRYYLLHSSGQSIGGFFEIDDKGGMQLVGGRITYARRYTLCAVTGITADEDVDARDDSQSRTVQRRQPASGGQQPQSTAQRRPRTQTSPPAQAVPPSAGAAHPPQAAAGGDQPPLPGEEDNAPGPGTGNAPAARQRPAGSDSGTGPGAPEQITPKQLTAIWTVLSETFLFGKDERDEAREVCAHIVNHELASSRDLSKREAATVLDTLAYWETEAEREGESPRAYLQMMLKVTGGDDGDE